MNLSEYLLANVDWLLFLQWFEVDCAIFCCFLLMNYAWQQRSLFGGKASAECDELCFRVSQEEVGEADVEWLAPPLPLKRPLQQLLRHHQHPCRWDLIQTEIDKPVGMLVTVSNLVIQTSVLVGLVLTFVGIMASIQAMETDSSDVSAVLRGFRLALVSSLIGMGITIFTIGLRTAALNFHQRQSTLIKNYLMQIEPWISSWSHESSPEQTAEQSSNHGHDVSSISVESLQQTIPNEKSNRKANSHDPTSPTTPTVQHAQPARKRTKRSNPSTGPDVCIGDVIHDSFSAPSNDWPATDQAGDFYDVEVCSDELPGPAVSHQSPREYLN